MKSQEAAQGPAQEAAQAAELPIATVAKKNDAGDWICSCDYNFGKDEKRLTLALVKRHKNSEKHK